MALKIGQGYVLRPNLRVVLSHRTLVALGFVSLLVGEGAFFDWDFVSILSGDLLLVAVLATSIVLLVLCYVRPSRGILLAAGIAVSFVPALVLFVFGAILALADLGDRGEFLGVILFLVALGLALPAAILGYRAGRAA